ncbi:MAG: ORF6N domain-containing protein, partial [Cytophagaceae bacterium]|nr:ORF6N domain-containing protein [Cytophagaceae bacterium]
MDNKQELQPVSDEVLMSKIFIIRGQKVMLDKDLAELYNVETKALNQSVKRNWNRFPIDFMFQLTEKEFNTNLRSQFVTSSWGGGRYMPYVFTEQGVAMLSSVLKSERAIEVNIRIIRMFTKLREMLFTNKEVLLKLEKLEGQVTEHNSDIQVIFKYLKELLTP